MNKPSTLFFNFFLYFVMLLISIVLQTSLFHWIIGGRSTLQIAIVIMTYICLYRSNTEAFIFIFLSSYCLGLASTMLQSVSIFAGMCIFITTIVVKNQVYSSSPSHFSRMALSNIFLFHLISWLVSSVFENTTPQFRPLGWVLEVLITALFVKLFFIIFQIIDEKTKRIEFSELDR